MHQRLFLLKALSEILAKMPQIGAVAVTPEGRGTIIDTYTLLEMVKVKVRLKDGTDDVFQYGIQDIELTGKIDPSYQKNMDNDEKYIKELDKLQ